MRRWLLALALAATCRAPAPAPLPATVPSALGPVPVLVTPNLHEGREPLFGHVDFAQRVIRIRAGLAPVVAQQALAHERCHLALWDGAVRLDEATEEQVCDVWGVAAVRDRE